MSDNGEHKHHILSDKTSFHVAFWLLVFTLITVAVAQFDFGAINFPLAMVIATFKAMLVMLYFMGLKYDNNENRVIFFGSFAFFGFFLFYVAADLFNRDEASYVDRSKPIMEAASGTADIPLFEQPWDPKPEDVEQVMARGKELYVNSGCASCHGDSGGGDGPAGAAIGARNFQVVEGWKNGRSSAGIYKTLTEGVGALMAAYPTIHPLDRLALAEYVQSFGPEAPKSSVEELKAQGIDPSKEYGGLLGDKKEEVTIPIEFAKELYIR